MKRLLPGVGEIGVLAFAAIACAILASLLPAWDVALTLGSMPIFVMAAIMGLRSKGHLAAAPVEASTPEESANP